VSHTVLLNPMTEISQLHLRWLDFASNKDRIRDLRKKVFIEEQALGEFVLDSEHDQLGLHLGLFDGDDLVSSISLFLYTNSHPFIQSLGLESARPYLVQYSRRAELPAYRAKKFASLLVAHAIKSVWELFQPDIMFATLAGVHKELKDMYIKMYGFNKYFETMSDHGEIGVLVMDEEDVTKRLVLNMRNACLELSQMHNLELPDLAYHIEQHEHLTKAYKMEADGTNRYLQPLSLQDELPRLSAQARMLILTQEKVWKNLFSQNPGIKKVLDIGCGPGVYLSNLSKLADSNEIEWLGMDISERFITYARFSHPKLTWKVGTAYDTKLEEGSLDLVHASFLFIHLMKPYLALREINRILSPNGIFYISDVNDDTFKGPEVISSMVAKHSEMYEGNRKIMLDIDNLSDKAGFERIAEHIIRVENTGSDDQPRLEGNVLKLGKWTMWAMFSFMGQREEIKDQFGAAEAYYLNNSDTISIEIQTKIYKKSV